MKVKCPKCGEVITVGTSRTLEAAIADLSNHVSHMMAHIAIALSASAENPVDRAYEMRQVEAAAQAQVLIVQALTILVGEMETPRDTGPANGFGRPEGVPE